MGKQIQLSIAEPCHENWDNMTGAEQGRFCASCQKQVIDFGNMSDAQLAAFFKKPTTDSVCGRFYGDQLNRRIQIPKKSLPWIKYFFQIALPAFLMSVKASGQEKEAVKNSTELCVPRPRIMGKIALPRVNTVTTKDSLAGRVLDDRNDPIPFAVIQIDASTATRADVTGSFVIRNLPDQAKITLIVQSVGFEMKRITITKNTDLTKELTIHMNSSVMGFVTMRSPHPFVKKSDARKAAKAARKAAKTTVSAIIPDSVFKLTAEKPAMIKIYPNPVVSGTAINIGCEKLEEGYYSFQLSDLSGKQIESKQAWIDAEARIMNMEIPSVAAGTYMLTLIHKESGKRFSEKVVVQ